MVFHGAARVLGGELRLQEPADLSSGNTLLVLIIKALLDPLGGPDVGHTQSLRATEQQLAPINIGTSTPLTGAANGKASIGYMPEFMEVNPINLDGGTGEQVVAVVARLRMTTWLVETGTHGKFPHRLSPSHLGYSDPWRKLSVVRTSPK